MEVTPEHSVETSDPSEAGHTDPPPVEAEETVVATRRSLRSRHRERVAPADPPTETTVWTPAEQRIPPDPWTAAMASLTPPPPEPTPEPAKKSSPAGPRTVQDVGRGLIVPSVWAVLIALIVGGAVAFLGADYERTRPTVYQTAAVVLLDSPVSITTNPGAVVAISEVRGKYAGLVGTDVISQPAAQNLGLPASLVAGSVSPLLGLDNLDIILRARAGSAQLAQQLARGVAQALVKYVTDEQAALPTGISPLLKINMTLIADPPLGSVVSPTHRKEITTGGVYGGVALAATYVIAQVAIDARRTKRRRRPARA